MPDKQKIRLLKLVLTIYKVVVEQRNVWINNLQNWLEKHNPKIELLLGTAALSTLIYTQGFSLNKAELVEVVKYDRWIATTYAIVILVKLFFLKDKKIFIKENAINLLFIFSILVILVVRVFFMDNYQEDNEHWGWSTYIVVVQVIMIVASLDSLANNRSTWLFFTANSTSMIVGSLLFIIVMGTGLLMLPEATLQPINWVDALFTSTSAVCVTGLAPFNISEVFTFKGQLILMFLFQIGGLGIVTLTTFIALTIQKGVKIREEFMIQDMVESDSISSSADILKKIFYITFTIELIGAVALYIAWGDLNLSNTDRIFVSIFHSISAFCNAGFSNFPNGLQGNEFSTDWFSGTIIMLLIIVGGIGFKTYSQVFKRKEKFKRNLCLQSRISINVTLFLIFFGAVGLYITDFNLWNSQSTSDSIFQIFFTSITCRTAGFSVVEVGDLSVGSIMMMIMLMYVGGAPNSTAGGIKVTTAYILLKYLKAQITGHNHVHIGWNTIEESSIRRAVIVFMMSILLSFFGLFLLVIAEPLLETEDLFFEFFSAMGTAGLSRGITAELSIFGKLLIALIMFSGKIGLFTLVSLLGENHDNFKYRYPETSILVG
ncbi:TrkH family potassium uptake protein [Flammeovirga sp. OC4]|uniref:TrkH family potassium uptake protein n=1 Tax=Flammeovirga sp. OC4 TaxID=1382345 RepID=UPI0005C6115A|nr:potassium transporter TrkG [Flammeovirga sp. OC4]